MLWGKGVCVLLLPRLCVLLGCSFPILLPDAAAVQAERQWVQALWFGWEGKG